MHYLPDSREEKKKPVFVDNFFFCRGSCWQGCEMSTLSKKMHMCCCTFYEFRVCCFFLTFFFLQGLLLARLRDEQLVKKQAVLLSILAGLLHYAPAPAPQGVSVCTFVPVCAS
jgi:hypothetical protein